ncbi:FecR family protein [Aquirufa nivalisilvae]|uniref:FecR family protein n=1 Tax=Aquirufa nivalisilvae TaxID=2516557 RepID=UPI0022A8E698|nr:FecR family protein [Aquirufa nivalisilvae]MCZ2483161.1 FecR family protein [Aquirufa nivalisilvae]
MKTKEFDQLLHKYEHGNCTPEEIAFIESISSDSMSSHADLSHLFNEKMIHEEEDRLWNKLSSTAFQNENRVRFITQSRILKVALAASLVLICSISIYLRYPDLFQKSILESKGLETRNISNINQTLQLPDGSTVILEKNSSLIVAEDFGKLNRTVFLKGKGYFKVARNEKKPFLVRMGDLVTEVLGTSFKVGLDNKSKSVEVAVLSGKVSVYLNSKNESLRKLNGVVLTPNLKAVYNLENQTIQESIVEEPILIVPGLQKSDFIFDEIQFGALKDRFKYYYGVDIIFVNKEIEKCLFTGDLSGLNLYKQLELACSSVNAKFEIRGSTVFINGKSCN